MDRLARRETTDIQLPTREALEAECPKAIAHVGEHAKRLTQSHTQLAVDEVIFSGSPDPKIAGYGHGWLAILPGTRGAARFERFTSDVPVAGVTVTMNLWAALFLHPVTMRRQLYWSAMADPLRRIEALLAAEVPVTAAPQGAG